MSFGLWIAILATANFWLYALWYRLSSRPAGTDNDHYWTAIEDAETQRVIAEATRLWDAALDEERRVREEEAAWAQSGDELVREIELWLESREMTS